jgi:hypothetical protein
MKQLILLLSCIAFFSYGQEQQKKKTTKYLISGLITSTSSYCGGARPSDEMLADIATPRPFPSKTIYIKKGEVNSQKKKIVLVLTTDTNGRFQAKLPLGKYLIVDENKKDLKYYNQLLKKYKVETTNFEAVDTVCLKKWYSKPDYVLKIDTAGVINININYHKECYNLPCTQFRGPYPP